MKCKIEISMDNAAFFDNPTEIHHILSKAAAWAELAQIGSVGVLRDSNGNKVGTVTLEED